jgi:hypothetical protein
MRWLKNLGGSIVTYVVVAACAGSANTTPGGGGARDSGSLLDAMTNPVPDAMASPQTVAVEPCDKSYVYSGTTITYAEHLFPGKSMADLVSVTVIYATTLGAPPGYANSTSHDTWIRDGAVFGACTPGAQSVTFVLP